MTHLLSIAKTKMFKVPLIIGRSSKIGSSIARGPIRGLLRSGLPNCATKRLISLKPDLSKLKLTQPPPGGVVGGVNDAFKPPEPNHFHGSYHWDYERITAVSLIPLTTIPLYTALSGGVVHPLLDASLCVMLILHAHYGFMSCIIDYIPKRKFGPWHNLARYLLYGGSAVGLYGVYDLETNNNGIVDLIAKLLGRDDSNLYLFGGN